LTRVCSLALVCVLSLAFASAARASVTVGQLFTPNTDCNTPGTGLQTGVASGNSYSVPSAGVITSWSWEDGANTVPELEFKVARHVSGDDYTIAGTSLAGAQTANTVSTYPARIRVQAGDVIGVFQDGGTCGSLGASSDTYESATGTNEPLSSTDTYTPYSEWLFPVAAKLEPDVDEDGYGDETQDLCPTDASTHGACPSTSTTPAAPSTPSSPGAKDRTPPSLTATIARLLKLSKSGSLSFFLTSGENAAGTATGTINLPKSAKVVRFKRAAFNLTAGKRTKVTLRLSKSALKSIRKALMHHRLKAKLTVAVKDAAGNQAFKKLTRSLQR
jgi:hypothetical protein